MCGWPSEQCSGDVFREPSRSCVLFQVDFFPTEHLRGSLKSVLLLLSSSSLLLLLLLLSRTLLTLPATNVSPAPQSGLWPRFPLTFPTSLAR